MAKPQNESDYESDESVKDQGLQPRVRNRGDAQGLTVLHRRRQGRWTIAGCW